MAEDAFGQLAEIGGRETEQQRAVGCRAGLLCRMPDLFRYPRRDLRRKAENDLAGLVALHDAERAAGVFLDGRQIVRQGESFVGGGCRFDARQGEIAQRLAGGAPGDQVPVAHVVHEVERLDGAARFFAGMGRVVGDAQGRISKQGADRFTEAPFVDPGVLDILDRDLVVHRFQAVLPGAGMTHGPGDDGAEVVFEGLIGNGGGKAHRQGQGQDVGLTEPAARQLVGVVGVVVAVFAADKFEWGVEPLAHEVDVALGGALGDAEFGDKVGGVGVTGGGDLVVEPEKPLIGKLVGHLFPHRLRSVERLQKRLGERIANQKKSARKKERFVMWESRAAAFFEFSAGAAGAGGVAAWFNRGRGRFGRDLSITIIPAIVFPDKTADLVQHQYPAPGRGVGDELHQGLIGVTFLFPQHVEMSPARNGGRVDGCRSGGWVPGCQQIVGVFDNIGSVPGAHQGAGRGGRGDAVNKWRAAVGK